MRAILACLLLAGCGTTVQAVPKPQPQTATIAAAPVTQTVVKTVCPPLVTYTAAQEAAMSAAVRALQGDNPLVGAMIDYGQLRAAIRACKAS